MVLAEYMVAEAAVAKKSKTKDLFSDRKKDVFLSFDEDLLVDAKKILFKNKTTLQQFFSFILFKMSNRHEDMEKILVEFNDYCLKQALSKEQEEAILNLNSEKLYSYFEDLDKQTTEQKP